MVVDNIIGRMSIVKEHVTKLFAVGLELVTKARVLHMLIYAGTLLYTFR